MKKILIINSSAFTIGDIAISVCMIEQILKVVPGAQIVIESGNPHIHKKYISDKNVDIIQRLYDTKKLAYSSHYLSFAFLVKNFKVIFQYLLDSLELLFFLLFGRSVSKRKIFKAMREADIIISAGGDALTKHYGYFLRLYVFLILKLMKKKIIIYASTIGPFCGVSKFFIIHCLKKLDLILVRDKRSYNFLIDNGLNEKIVKQVADCVILLQQKISLDSRKNIEDLLISKKTIGIFLKKLLYLEGVDMKKYLKKIKDVIENINVLGYDTVVFSANNADYEVGKNFVKEFNLDNKVINLMNYSSGECKEILSRLGLVITSRMHPAILTTISSVPVIGISDESKMLEYFKIIDIQELYLRPAEVEVFSLVNLIVNTIGNIELQKRLNSGLFNASLLANKNIEYFNNWLSNND